MSIEQAMPGEQAIDVSVLVISYNTRGMTLAALASLRAETREAAIETIVVDNASVDGSADAIEASGLATRLIALGENLGFAAGNNLAAREARGRYILLLNPDTVVREGAVDRLVAFARARPGARVWGGRTLFADGRLNPGSCWGRMTVWNLFCRAGGLTGLAAGSALFNGEAYGGWQRDQEAEVDIVSGCFLLIERELWEELGGFDPVFFMYGEDADLCLRARALGARPMITPAATIVHHGGASEKVRADKLVRLLAAKATLIKRHFPFLIVPIGLALHAAWPLSRLIALSVLAFVTGGRHGAEGAGVWRSVWAARARWLAGWPDKGGSKQGAALPAGR